MSAKINTMHDILNVMYHVQDDFVKLLTDVYNDIETASRSKSQTNFDNARQSVQLLEDFIDNALTHIGCSIAENKAMSSGEEAAEAMFWEKDYEYLTPKQLEVRHNINADDLPF